MTAQSPPLFLTPPRAFGATLVVGSAGATSRNVTIVLESADAVSGFANVTEMKVWGDIDPGYRPEVFGDSEGAANWQPYQQAVELVLSAGDGGKGVMARLRNASGFVTEVIDQTVALNSVAPHISILWTDERRLLQNGGLLRYGWSASDDFDAWQIVMCPSLDTPLEGCVQVADGGSASAGVAQWMVLGVSDLEEADPAPTQAGAKWLRTLIQIGDLWYGGPGEQILSEISE